MKIEYKWTAMIIVSIGVFMATLDGSIVNVALPAITEYFNTDITTIEWVITAYLLTITSLLLSFGRLSDMVGRKMIFSAGFIVFTAGSALCAVSGNETELILFRIIQGIGAAMIMANGPAIVTHAFPEKERGKALGLLGTMVAVGSMTGPVLGGFLIDGIGWRSIFYINIPIGIFGLFAITKYLHEEKDLRKNQKFDFLGAGTLFISLVSLLLALSMGQSRGWNSLFILGLFTFFISFLIIFVIVEKKVNQPMIELHLFNNRTFAAANISAFISFAAMFSVIFLMPFYLEKVLQYSTTRVGIVLASVPLVMSLAAPFSGWISDRSDSHLHSTIGLAVASFAVFLLSGLDSGSGYVDITLRLGLLGLGLGLFQPPNSSIIMGSMPKERLGIAAGTMATMRNLGMVIGVAVAGAVFSNRLDHYAINAFVGAFQDTYIVAALICTAGVMTSMIRGRGIKSS